MPENKPPVAHYCRGQIQPIDFLESWFTPDEYRGYCIGTAIYYLLRHNYKGTPLADIKKAQDYIDFFAQYADKREAVKKENE